MATYKTYNMAMPKSWEDYMPQYKTYSYAKPNDVYSDYFSPYKDDIWQAQKNLSELEAKKPGEYQSAYQKRIDELINTIGNRKFSYDLGKDALYQQYRDNYMSQGKQAMQDTMGQAAALTGGYGNSYAAAAGNQAYQAWLGQLNNKIPELYQLALQKYNTEGDELQNMYGMLSNQESVNYGKYRDTVSDYQTNRAYEDSRLQNLRNMGQNLWGQQWNNYLNTQQMNDANRQNAINAALNLYGTAWDNYRWGEQQTASNRAQAVAEDQWNAEFNYQQQKDNLSAREASLSSQLASLAAEKDSLTNQKAINDFISGLMTESQLKGPRGNYHGYRSYKDYVEKTLQKSNLSADQASAVMEKLFGKNW